MVYFSIIINRRLLRGIAKGPPVVDCHCIQLSRYGSMDMAFAKQRIYPDHFIIFII